MCLRFVFLLVTRLAAWLRLSRREEAWQTAEILLLRHQLAVLQRQQPRHPNLNWADRALIASLLAVIPKAADLLLHGAGRYRLAWHSPVSSARPAGVRLACTGSGSWMRQAGTGSVCGPVGWPAEVPVIGGQGWSPQSPLDELEPPGWCR